MDSIEAYFAFSEQHPELFQNSDLIPLCMEEPRMREFAADTGKEMGMVFENPPYFCVLADLCFKNEQFYRYARVVSPNSDSDGVVIIPVKQGKLGLISIYRHAPRTMSLEFVRGFSEESPPVDSAVRETQEEIGANIAPGKFEFLGDIRSNTGLSAGKIQVFTVEIEDAQISAQNGEGIDGLRWLTVQEFREAIAKSEITCGITLAAYAKYLYRNVGKSRGEKRDGLAEFQKKLAERGKAEGKKYTGYTSQLRFANRSGKWMKEQINNMNFRNGVTESDFWEGIDDLTQLPEQMQVEIIAFLLDDLYLHERKSDIKESQAGLKKLGPVLQLYRDLMLDGKQPPEPSDWIPQEGPLCFAAILKLWVSLDKDGKVLPLADTGLENQWIRELFCFLKGVSVPQKEASLYIGEYLRPQESSKICTSLVRARTKMQNLYGDKLSGDAKKNLSNQLGKFGFQNHSFKQRLRAINDYLAKQDTSACSVNLRREIRRLGTLEQSLEKFGNGKYDRLGYKVLFFEIFLSLLTGTLQSDSAIPDVFESIRQEDDGAIKLFYCIRRTGATLTDGFWEYIRKNTTAVRLEKALYSIPSDEAALDWVKIEYDIIKMKRDRPYMEQVCQLSQEAPVILNVVLPDDAMDIENYEIACAAKAILLLLIRIVEEQQSVDEAFVKNQFQIARNLLYCFDVIRKDNTTPEEASTLHNTVMHLLKLKVAALAMNVRKYNEDELNAMLESVFSENEEYLRFLEACQALGESAYSKQTAQDENSLRWSEGESNLLNWEVERVKTALGGISTYQKASTTSARASSPLNTATPAPQTNREHDTEFQRPVVSNVFDSVATASAQEVQLTLASIILRSRRLILLGPQILDNPQVLELVKNSNFLRLIQNGCISFSAYGKLHNLLDYAQKCFADGSTFRFSGYQVFEHEEDGPNLRACMREYLRAEDSASRKRSREAIPAEYRNQLEAYAQNIQNFSYALDQQLKKNQQPLYSFYHQETGWLKNKSRLSLMTEIKSHIQSLENGSPKKADLIQRLLSLHQSVLTLTRDIDPDSVTRSQIFHALARISDPSAPKNDYCFIVNSSYFKQITERVTPYREIRVNPPEIGLLPENAQKSVYQRVPAKGPCNSVFTMGRLADFFDEAQKYVERTGARTARDIISGVLRNDASAQMEDDCSVSFISQVEDPVSDEISVIEQKADEYGVNTIWNSNP